MTIQTKREYIALLWDLYRQAKKRSDKSRLLDQICQMLAMHAALPEWLGYEAEFSRTLQLDILKVSARSLERIVREERAKWRRKQNTGTRRAEELDACKRPLGLRAN